MELSGFLLPSFRDLASGHIASGHIASDHIVRLEI
jgi:hypothetical protein